MTRWTRTLTKGQVASGEFELTWGPRTRSDGNKRGIILAHGAGNTSAEWHDPSLNGSFALGNLLADLGYWVVAADFGGPTTFGNDTAVASIASAWTVLKALGCKTDKAIGVGVSMGCCNLLNASAQGTVPFAGIAGIIPLLALGSFRDNNRAGDRDFVNTAWGLPAGSTSATNPLPARADPFANTAAINPTPVYVSTSSADTVVVYADAQAMEARLTNCTFITHSTTLDHSEASVLAAVQRPELLTFLAGVS